MTRLFGTNGIRGIVNNTIDGYSILQIAKAIGTMLHTNRATPPQVAIGADARLSNTMLTSAATAGLLATGCNVIDLGLAPTPAIQYTVRENKYTAGIVITASHNPPQFNGLKGIAADGTEFSIDTETTVEDIYFKQAYQLADWKTIGTHTTWDGAIDLYIKGILNRVNVSAIKEKKFHIVLDCGNGAGAFATPKLLKKLGVTYTPLFCEPDGTFPGRHSEPTPENLSAIMKAVQEQDADFGIAQDGDADRAIFIDEKGDYIWGDKSLALAGRYLARQAGGGIAVTPVTTSNCFEDVIKEEGGQVIYTAVGSPIVARVMIEHHALFGGEENGGLIFPQLQYCRDSAMSLAMFLEILAREHRPLSSLIAALPTYEVSKSKIACPNDKKQAVMDAIVKTVRDSDDVTGVDRTDGVKLFVMNGWVLMRPSGTEPIFRVYVQAKTKTDVEALTWRYTKIVEDVIKGLSR